MKHFRHGDVVLTKIDNLPSNLKRIEVRPLAYGEVTGHSHRVLVDNPSTLRMYQDDSGRLYLELEGNGKLVHEEHKTIPLEEGIYTTRIIREYNYAGETINEVRD